MNQGQFRAARHAALYAKHGFTAIGGDEVLVAKVVKKAAAKKAPAKKKAAAKK